MIGGFTWALKFLSLFTGLVNKAFGNLVYDKALSEYKQNYRTVKLEDFVKRTEG